MGTPWERRRAQHAFAGLLIQCGVGQEGTETAVTSWSPLLSAAEPPTCG